MKLRAIFIVKKEKTMKELPKTYEPRDVEDRLYKFWVDNGYFHAERDPDKKPFTIVMPPPNVTGQLHMGHAMDAAMQDVLIRFKRMQGYSALWIPGVDHAGIATQIRVEEELRKEGKTRYDLGREKFLERVWAWKHQYGDRIVEQQKRLGASCDWDRARFTMDEGCSKAVREVFVNLYEQGLIYKGSRIINWCPHCVTALSDAEVEYVDKPGHLWHVRYPLADGSGEVIIATTRPETMLGDSGVCVNPNDERYKDITVRMLLNHSSGLLGTGLSDAMLFGEASTRAHETLLEKLSTQTLAADPGAFSVYCNDGFSLAELVVEAITDMDFMDYVDEHILAPLDLDRTFAPGGDFDANDLAPIYRGTDPRALPQDALNAIADKAIERNIGARGLRAVMEGLLTKVMYEIPSDETVVKAVVTKECVEGTAEPELTHDPNKINYSVKLNPGRSESRSESGTPKSAS